MSEIKKFKEAFEQIEFCKFECEGGNLENNVGYLYLKKALLPKINEKLYLDRHGEQIIPGQTLCNPHDEVGEYIILQDKTGELFLGDFDSPLYRYNPTVFWEIKQN